MLIVTVLMVLLIILLAWAWVRGINNMKDDHPDYKGEDFLDWGDDEEDMKEFREWDVTLMDGLEDKNEGTKRRSTKG